MSDKLLLITLAVFFLIFGFVSVTNIKIEWDKPLMGFAALVAGVIYAIRAFK